MSAFLPIGLALYTISQNTGKYERDRIAAENERLRSELYGLQRKLARVRRAINGDTLCVTAGCSPPPEGLDELYG